MGHPLPGKRDEVCFMVLNTLLGKRRDLEYSKHA